MIRQSDFPFCVGFVAQAIAGVMKIGLLKYVAPSELYARRPCTFRSFGSEKHVYTAFGGVIADKLLCGKYNGTWITLKSRREQVLMRRVQFERWNIGDKIRDHLCELQVDV